MSRISDSGKLRFISICIPPEINGNFRKINDGFTLQCNWKGFPYPEVQLRSSGDILAHNHGNQSRLSYGPVDENDNYTCWAENAAGLAVYNVVMKDHLATNQPTMSKMTEDIFSTIPQNTEENNFLVKFKVMYLVLCISLAVAFTSVMIYVTMSIICEQEEIDN